MNRVRVGLIGCGNSGLGIHRPRIERLSELFELVAYCDPDPARLATALEGREARQYANPDEMLDAEHEIELVTIATKPFSEHTTLAAQALETGRAVVLEKPVGVDLADVQGLFDAVERTDGWLFPFQSARLHVPIVALCQAVEGGRVGRLRYASVRRPCSGAPGQVLDLGTHALDQLLCLAGHTRPVEVFGHFVDDVDSIAEAGRLYAAIRFEDGVLGVLELGADRMGAGAYDFRVVGTAGTVYSEWCDRTADLFAKHMRMTGAAADWTPDLFEGEPQTPDFLHLLEDRFYRNVYASLREGVEPLVTLDQVRQQFAVFEAVLASSKAGRAVDVRPPSV